MVRSLNPISTQTELEVVDIPINKVKVINRMRRTDENNVEDLMRSIREIGLIHCICVAKRGEEYVLLSGMHRYIAMERIGYTTIPATIREDDKLINQLVEIEENLVAKRNNAIEEAEAIILREQILIKLGRKAVVGSNQYTEKKITNEDLAKQLGYTRRTYSYKKSVANITPEAKDILCETKFANSMMDMYRLQKLPDHLQVEIANLLASRKAKTFKRAWVLAHLKFKQGWSEDKQKIKDELDIPKSIMRFDRKKNVLNDICSFVSHNEDAAKTKLVGQFGTNVIKNYSMLPEHSNYFVKYFSNEGDLICDNFCGRGTNVVAAAYNQRRVIGYDMSPHNLQLIKTACLENTSIKDTDLALHHSDGVEMAEYKDSKDIVDLFLLDPPYYGAEDYGSNDDRDLCYIKDVEKFNARFKTCLINMKRLVKPSNYKSKIFKPIIIKCGSIRIGSNGIIDMADEIITMAKDIGLVLHDKIFNKLRSATQYYNLGKTIENRYTVKSHETSLVFLKYCSGT